MVIGRDARISGEMVSMLVAGSLMGMGIHVIDLGFATTPTVEIAVTHTRPMGESFSQPAIIRDNGMHLKLLNARGEFISAEDGAELLAMAAADKTEYAQVTHLARLTRFDKHE